VDKARKMEYKSEEGACVAGTAFFVWRTLGDNNNNKIVHQNGTI